jgi:cellulose biosynthesis protein BcsQ
MKAKKLTIFGSGGSGKTTLAVKLALELRRQKADAVVLFLDFFTPMLPLITQKPNTKSLGSLLEESKIDEKKILEYLLPLSGGGQVACLGYSLTENAMSHRSVSKNKIYGLINALSEMTDYVIFDCLSMHYADKFSLAALEEADTLIGLYEHNEKSVVNFSSNFPFLQNKYQDKNMLLGLSKVEGNLGGNSSVLLGENAAGILDFVMPFVPLLEEQMSEAKLHKPMHGKLTKRYEGCLERIVELC